MPFSLRHALREVRWGARRIGWFMAAIALGVAVLIALYGFREDAAASARNEARALLGGDLRLQSGNPFDPAVEAILDSLVAQGAEVARGTSLASVVSSASGGAVRLLQINAVDRSFPAAGRPVGEPVDVPGRLAAGGGAAVDPQVMGQLGVLPGDQIQIGTARFEVLGTLSGVPVDFGLQWVVGPPVFISADDLPATGILGFGSLAQYRAWILMPAGGDPEAFLRRYRRVLQSYSVSVRTADQEAESLAAGFAGLARFFGLIGLISLLLGGIGVGSAVSVYLKEKRTTMAVLRCIGARQGTLFRAYLLQILLLGAAGAAAGVVGGVILQYLIPLGVNRLLPFTVTPGIHPEALLAGFLLGTWVAVVFALLPLLGVRGISPIVALRNAHLDSPAPLALRGTVAALMGGSILALAALQLGAFRPALAVTFGLLAALAILGGIGKGLGRAVAVLVPPGAPFAVRQGLSGIARPGNQTVMVVTALGIGTFLTGAVIVVERGMRAGVSLDFGADRPSLALFDIQSDQRGGIETILAGEGVSAEMIPLVPSRLASVNSVPVSELLQETRSSQAWMYRRVYRNTYRAAAGESENVVAGVWWEDAVPPGPELDLPGGGRALRVSLEADLARDLGVGVGDRLGWDVQGVAVESVITSIREVEWASMEPNFFAIFEPGGLEGAPATFVALIPATGEAARLRIQGALLRDYPNVSFIDVTMVQETLERISGDVALLLRAMAGFILAGGLLVLLASLLTTRFRRRHESALLKTLGASAGTIRGVLLSEYAALGAIGGAAGVLLGGLGGYLLLRWLFNLPIGDGPWGALAGLWAGVTLLAVVVGWSVSRPVLRSPAISVLREEP